MIDCYCSMYFVLGLSLAFDASNVCFLGCEGEGEGGAVRSRNRAVKCIRFMSFHFIVFRFVSFRLVFFYFLFVFSLCVCCLERKRERERGCFCPFLRLTAFFAGRVEQVHCRSARVVTRAIARTGDARDFLACHAGGIITITMIIICLVLSFRGKHPQVGLFPLRLPCCWSTVACVVGVLRFVGITPSWYTRASAVSRVCVCARARNVLSAAVRE